MSHEPWKILSRVQEPDSEAFADAELLRNAIEATRDGVTISDARQPDMPLIYVNPAFEAMSGYRSEEIIHKNCRFLQGDDTDQEGVKNIRDAIANRTGCLVTLRNYRKDGNLFHNELSLSPVRGQDGAITHYVGIQKDVTSRVNREALLARREADLTRLNKHLNELAATDQLTGIMNRRAFDIAMEREWRRARRSGATLSIFMIDLDHFKSLNDNHGHAIGDECLKRVATALTSVFGRATDYVARYGGEEFVVLCAKIGIETGLAQGQRLLQTIRTLEMPAGVSSITTSVGLCTLAVNSKLTPEQFLKAADTALYSAKRSGRDRIMVSDISSVAAEGKS